MRDDIRHHTSCSYTCSQDIEVDHLARGRILTQCYMECKGHVAVLLLSELQSILMSTYVACA